MINFEKLWESLSEAREPALPDWLLDGIELYLQAFDSGDVEGEPAVEDTLDFVMSINPDEELTDELRAAAEKEIEAYLPLSAPEEEEPEPDDEDDDPYDEWADPEAPQVDRQRQYPDAKDIDIVQHGINTFTLVDKTSGEVLSKPMSMEDAEQKLSHIATKNESLLEQKEITGKEIEAQGSDFFNSHTFTSRAGNTLIKIWKEDDRIYGQFKGWPKVNITRRHFTTDGIDETVNEGDDAFAGLTEDQVGDLQGYIEDLTDNYEGVEVYNIEKRDDKYRVDFKYWSERRRTTSHDTIYCTFRPDGAETARLVDFEVSESKVNEFSDMTNAEAVKKLENWVRVCRQRKPRKVNVCQRVLDIISLENPDEPVSEENKALVMDMMRKVM